MGTRTDYLQIDDGVKLCVEHAVPLLQDVDHQDIEDAVKGDDKVIDYEDDGSSINDDGVDVEEDENDELNAEELRLAKIALVVWTLACAIILALASAATCTDLEDDPERAFDNIGDWFLSLFSD